MTSRFSAERDGYTGPVRADIDLQRSSSLRRTRSKKKRRLDEMDEKRRIRGDSHWSKLLQVNTDTNGLRHKKCIRMCRSFSMREPPSCRLGLQANKTEPPKAPETGIFASIASRIRQWLQSKRRYEVSPVHESNEAGGRVESGSGGSNGHRTETIKEDYLIISKVNNYHPELKRSEASYSRKFSIGISKSSSAIATCATNGASVTPLNGKYFSNDKGTQHASMKPVVDINIEFADHCPPVDSRSHFVANPLKLNQNHTPKTAIMTPSTRALSRSQQLRQSRSKYMKLLQKAGQLSPGRSPLTGTISAPAKHGLGEKGSSPIVKRRQIKTWPLPCRKQLRPDDDESCVGDSEMELPFIQEMSINYDRFGLRGKSSLKDFSINFKDLTLGELHRKGRRCKLYKGRWHGDVVVHVFGKLRQKDKDAFWANLGKLCRIRHENIILFMAACTSQPNLAVVTCSPQGKSLYEHIHIQHEKMTLHTKIGVLRQIALGMGYLHAKGIVLRKLNTKNVFVGHKVKVSAMDYGFPDSAHDRPDHGTIPKGHLTYIAPEIMCTIRVIPPRLVPFSAYSPETDVFAFGTIMYEVLTGKFPFHGALPEKIIWQICAGHRQILYNLKCSAAIKTLIEDCWAHEPLYRPEFRELCKDLQRHSPLHKKHSSSEPERLNRAFDLFET
ncbi:kinase suppressor of Ras 2-like isoform X1 [Biomphalaria glabrata]|uniref:Kinase suppressor of Ras 2-like isoform X1 n=1 Tax=Biomphalaria glabrata TaxID=6526 RepID=A0A9W2YYP7_BIOGL|nr:kinase suppressor of Ras 2-like isoform X1 [Biomphalaria glabrata]XP_055867843.1 kinase suppressor of Ras 2-like isoform X1 [Biomphalaria glabrata]XP_055867848.1 kinase suppressor of Ras 2-like isoform X1 [Biomphalaria glabrata]